LEFEPPVNGDNLNLYIIYKEIRVAKMIKMRN
jgi:hypothetical protein